MVTSKIPQVLPPGTTHFCPAFGRYPNRAMKLKGCDEWAYWTGFDWFDGCRPPPSVRREMIDVRPKVTGPSIAELIEQGYLAAIPFKCTAAPVTSAWNGPEDSKGELWQARRLFTSKAEALAAAGKYLDTKQSVLDKAQAKIDRRRAFIKQQMRHCA